MDDIKNKLDSIDCKLDEHTKILASVDKTLALQAQQLEQHMKRTNLAEENIKMLREDFKPLQAHVHFLNGFSKFLALTAAIVSAGAGVFELVKWIFKL